MNACAPPELPRAGPPIAILGVPFDNVSAAEAVCIIERMIQSRQPHYVVTANVDFLVQAREDVELRRILFDAHLVLCDGTPLRWASRWLGNRLVERVAGSDLVPVLIRAAEQKNFRLFLLGAEPQAAAQAVANLQKQFPKLTIAGHYSPPFRKLLEMDHDEIARRITQARPDLLFVSFGCPKQEKWIAMHYRSLGVPVTIGVGATIDFLAGKVKRAPFWMQRSGMEWIFRLVQEPRRLYRRYAKDLGVFGRCIAAQWWQLRLRPNVEGESNGCLTDRSSRKALRRLDAAIVRDERALSLLAEDGEPLLDLSQVQSVDSTGAGLLVRLQKNLRASGRELILLAPSPAVRRALKLMRLEDFFTSVSDFAAAERLLSSRANETPVTVNGSLFWQGELTAANAEQIWKESAPHLADNSRSGCLRIDLSRLRFIDSTGLGLMVRAKKFGRENGVRVHFGGAQPAVQNVIHIARLESFLLSE